MGRFVRFLSPARGLLPLLVVILVLGHVCELTASVEFESHHHSDGSDHSTGDNSHGQPGLCDAVTAVTSVQYHPLWTGLDMAVTLLVVDASPFGRTLQSFGKPAKLASPLPLFLLHSSFLI